MALCLYVTAAAAEDPVKVSYDIEITIASTDAHVTEISPDMPIKVNSVDLDATSKDIGKAVKKVVEVSFDSESADVKLMVKINGLAGDELKSADVAAIYLASADKGATTGAASVDITATSNDINVAWNDSFDLVVVVKGDGMGGSFVVVKVIGHGVEPAAAAFDSASIDVYYVVDEAETSKSVTVTKTASETISVDVGSTVSFDVSASSSDLTSADGYTTSSDYVFVLTAPTTAGESVDVAFAFNEGAVVYTFKIVASGDSSSATTETYKLNAGAIDFIGSDTAKTTKSVSAKTTYSTSQDTPVNWDAVDFEVSSADIATFTVTVSTDNAIVAAYSASDTDKTSVLSGDEIDFSGVVGEYVVVFSADLVLSTDEETTTTSDDTAYFSVTVTLTQAKEDTPSGLKETTADDAATSSDQNGNSVIAGGQTIDTKFLTNGTLTADTVSSFFGSATSVDVVTEETRLLAMLADMGFTDIGDEDYGYKAVALGLPDGVTLTAGDKFFVIITTSRTGAAGSKRAIGIGVLSANQVKTAGYLPIVFNLLRDPTDTNKYMGFDPDEYYVGATNDTASSDSGTTTRVVVVTAAGDFAIQSKEKTLLQGQNATTGAAVPYEDSGDDDDQETSSHGSSSGCDAGFGALALLAVAGALAARKVRK